MGSRTPNTRTARFLFMLSILGLFVGVFVALVVRTVMMNAFGMPYAALPRVPRFQNIQNSPSSLTPLPHEKQQRQQQLMLRSERPEDALRDFRSEVVQTFGLDAGDAVFYLPALLPLEDALHFSQVPHMALYFGDVDGDARLVHLTTHGFVYTRLESMFHNGGTVLVRKLRCPPEARAKFLEVSARAVETQLSLAGEECKAQSPLPSLGIDPFKAKTCSIQDVYTAAWIERGVQRIFKLKDTPDAGHTCTTASMLVLYDSGILTERVLKFWKPVELMQAPTPQLGDLPWAKDCSWDPVVNWATIPRNMLKKKAKSR